MKPNHGVPGGAADEEPTAVGVEGGAEVLD